MSTKTKASAHIAETVEPVEFEAATYLPISDCLTLTSVICAFNWLCV